MNIKKARQMLRDARRDGGRYTLDDYERVLEDLYNLLECDRKLVDTSDLCITGMKVLPETE